MTSLPCVRTQRHLHAQKLLTFFGGKILPDGVGNTTYIARKQAIKLSLNEFPSYQRQTNIATIHINTQQGAESRNSLFAGLGQPMDLSPYN
jgi:D-arabinose 5-phosphate isomerase GutQ